MSGRRFGGAGIRRQLRARVRTERLAGVVIPDVAAYRLGFSGSSSADCYCTVPTNPVLEPTAAFTVSFHFRVVSGVNAETGRTIWSQWDFTTFKSRFICTTGFSNATQLFVSAGNGTTNSSTRNAVTPVDSCPLDTDHHVVIRYNGAGADNAARMRIWVDGTEQVLTFGATAWGATIVAPGAPLEFGRWPGQGQQTFVGHVWDWRFYNTALSTDDIDDIFAGDPPTPTVHFDFTEGTGTTTTDAQAALVGTLSSTGSAKVPAWVIGDWYGGSDASGTKILPIGDSITDGSGYDGAWREHCRQVLYAVHKREIDFVGSLSDVAPRAEFAFDAQHYAVAGRRIKDASASDMIDGAAAEVTTYDPDVVTILGGINDIVNGDSVATALADLEELATLVDATKDGVPIVICSLPATNHASTASFNTFNAGLADLVADLVAAGVNASLCDVGAATTVADLFDTLHPNRIGYERIGRAIANHINGLL
jgi:lysophospholipase L1-like esterase